MSYVSPGQMMARLSTRDLAVLDDLEAFRLLTTRHLQRLHFPVEPGHHLTFPAATKAAMRVMTKLAGRSIVAPLERRIGGVRSGSQGYIWQLASSGANIQRYRRGEAGRRRYTEPSSLFTDHTLAVAELGVRLRELEHAGRLDSLQLETEPTCWREYFGPNGVPQTLKPDLYSVSASGEFEDHFFIEADLGTEHMPKILGKCQAYAAYLTAGVEQRERGVFPAVLWVAIDTVRADRMQKAIRGDPSLPQELFTVTTTEEFPSHVTDAADSS